jgi:outer membrane protein assembly factor BamB
VTTRRSTTCFSVALVVVLAAGCAQVAENNESRERSAAVWSTPVGWPFSFAVRGDHAVVTSSRNRVVNLDVEDGRERWHADLPHVTHHDPALDAGIVLISADDRFVALERDSGAPRWESSIGEHAGGVALTRGDGEPMALVTTERGVVAALDGDTGAVRWSVPLPGDIQARPAADARAGVGAVVWNGEMDRLRVFDLMTGATRWETAIDPSTTAPVFHAGVIVLGEGKNNFEARIVARDASTGDERWSVTAPASFEPGLTPGADGRDVAVSDHFGRVTLVDARRGSARWQTAIREPVLDTRVVLAARAVALTTYGGKVVILDRRSGRVVRRVDPGGVPVGLGTAGGRLVFAVRLARPDRVEALPLA